MSATESKKIGDVVLDVKNISLSFGGVKALTDISFDVREHEVRAIIGPNGAGKSSMLNCINGVYTPQKGTISFMGQTFDHMDSHQVATMGSSSSSTLGSIAGPGPDRPAFAIRTATDPPGFCDGPEFPENR